uniref:B30.2/SPRY domain-containing protein n=1 Tax=Ditylenchus dipsaci TaxID=166011 RepID=A0A915DIR8_9BILA
MTSGKGRQTGHRVFRKGDVIGCTLDLVAAEIRFSLNGQAIASVYKNFNLDGFFFPVMSLSAKVSCRFIFGRSHGKLKYGPPTNFSPVVEALNCALKVHECLSFGDLPKNIFSGPSTSLHQVEPFVPVPIDTSAIILPQFAQDAHIRFAENLHELWAMRKIDLGWIYGEVRNEQSRRHPCLTSFDHLPETEQIYNINLALDTMKAIEALGYHMVLDKPPTRLRPVRLAQSYVQTNGYKPQPLDTHEIELPENMEPLIDQLARNIHNVWAKEKIKRGWTFGLNEFVDATQKRTPHLVPYDQVDERIKEANREAAAENIRALQLFGIFLEPPVSEHDEGAEKEMRAINALNRTFRAEATYKVITGKWYYEFEVLTEGFMKVGWMDVSAMPDTKLGSDDKSYGFDGYLVKKWHQGAEQYGREWKIGDVIGCFLDLNDRTISFSMNGELLLDPSGSEMAFDNVVPIDGFVPAMTIAAGQKGKFNFGQDSNSLKYFTTCGLQEGFEPFCVNMYRGMPMWYAKRLPMFAEISEESRMEVNRVPSTAISPPCLKLSQKVVANDSTVNEKPRMEYIRLSLPVKCNRTFLRNKDKDAILKNLQDLQKRNASLSTVKTGQLSSGMPKDYEDTDKKHRTKGKTFLSAFRHNSEDDHHSHKGFSFDSSHNDALTDPPALIQRRRVLTLMNFGVYSFDESILTMLSLDGQDHDTFWIEHCRKSSLLNLSSDEKLSVENKLKDMTSRQDLSVPQPKKVTGILGRIRDRQRHKEDRHSEGKRHKGDESGESTLRTVKSYDSNSVVVDGVSSEMPSSGPGRQPTIRRNSIKKKKKKDFFSSGGNSASNTASPLASSMVSSEDHHRHSVVSPVGENLIDGTTAVDNDFYAMQQMGEQVDEYYYGVRIFPGQDPANVFVGWVTPQFHSYSQSFNVNDAVRKCRFNELDHQGITAGSVEYRNCYVLNALDLLNAVSDSANTKVSGLLIGCLIDISVGELSFMAAGQDTGMKFKLEPGALLYPAVFVTPTSNEILQFELGRIKYTFPLSAAMFKSSAKNLIPYCPPRLTAQKLYPVHWARVPNECARTTALKLSESRGWSVLCDDPVRALMVYIPERDSSLDILELIENTELLTFHSQTLDLYCKLTSHGNQKVAHTLCAHVDEEQLMYAVKSHYLSGPMRQGFYNFLNAVHLKTHADARLSTYKEYVLPLVADLIVSILPVMKSEAVQTDIPKDNDDARLLSPQINFEALKEQVIRAFKDATLNAVMGCRDLIGGNNLNHFEPILKLFDSLLIIGLITDEDIVEVLKLIHPAAFDESYIPGTTSKGLTEIELAEGVKMQLVNILDHLCDIQLRHRIESLICFCVEFVGQLQQDQCQRYMEIKQTDMPPAEAAKRTKEFRCPPREQMFRLLSCKIKEDKTSMLLDDDVEIDQCPMSESLQDHLRDFCTTLVEKLGCRKGVEDSSNPLETKKVTINELDEERSWVDSLAHLVVSVPPPPVIDDFSVYRRGTENFRQMIVSTLRRWANETEIESNELVRGIFDLMLRQYAGIRELMDAMAQTYVLHDRNIEDVEGFIVYLIQIRELLNVQLEKCEEAILKRGLWQLMNNRIFFQHPDMMRLLRVHEDVMTIMMNVLTAQQSAVDVEFSDSNSSSTNNASEMVVACSRFLCYFCRTSRMNQKAMFEHLSFLLDNATMLLARPSLRGSVPLDVAYSSFMDNNELALALKEEELDKVTVYLNYPDIGWDPVEGERYIDFLRFCVWINGENVEENANLVIRLLIRRPECLGIALKGEGQGLFAAFKEAIVLSEDIRALEEGEDPQFLHSPILRDNPKYPSKESEGEDYVDLGAAILDFYSSLVDLLAKCAPDPLTIQVTYTS